MKLLKTAPHNRLPPPAGKDKWTWSTSSSSSSPNTTAAHPASLTRCLSRRNDTLYDTVISLRALTDPNHRNHLSTRELLLHTNYNSQQTSTGPNKERRAQASRPAMALSSPSLHHLMHQSAAAFVSNMPTYGDKFVSSADVSALILRCKTSASTRHPQLTHSFFFKCFSISWLARLRLHLSSHKWSFSKSFYWDFSCHGACCVAGRTQMHDSQTEKLNSQRSFICWKNSNMNYKKSQTRNSKDKAQTRKQNQEQRSRVLP